MFLIIYVPFRSVPFRSVTRAVRAPCPRRLRAGSAPGAGRSLSVCVFLGLCDGSHVELVQPPGAHESVDEPATVPADGREPSERRPRAGREPSARRVPHRPRPETDDGPPSLGLRDLETLGELRHLGVVDEVDVNAIPRQRATLRRLRHASSRETTPRANPARTHVGEAETGAPR